MLLDQSCGKLKNTEIEKLFGCYLCNYSYILDILIKIFLQKIQFDYFFYLS